MNEHDLCNIESGISLSYFSVQNTEDVFEFLYPYHILIDIFADSYALRLCEC